MYSLSKNDKEKMHDEICTLLRKIKRPGANVEDLIKKLEETDFFEAPASTKFHNCFSGGLADHSLNVYYNLKRLVENKHLEDVIPEESIIICGLLHDMSKINYYEKSVKNKKVYSELGSKYDSLGYYDWISEESYAVKPAKDRFIYGNHEETSEFMVRQYIPLKVAESVAILHHHGGKGYDSTNVDLSIIYAKYVLSNLLHVADMIATYTDEEN